MFSGEIGEEDFLPKLNIENPKIDVIRMREVGSEMMSKTKEFLCDELIISAASNSHSHDQKLGFQKPN